MELQKAIEVLELHQKWRLGDDEIIQTNARELTESIDTVLKEVKTNEKQLIAFSKWQNKKDLLSLSPGLIRIMIDNYLEDLK